MCRVPTIAGCGQRATAPEASRPSSARGYSHPCSGTTMVVGLAGVSDEGVVEEMVNINPHPPISAANAARAPATAGPQATGKVLRTW